MTFQKLSKNLNNYTITNKKSFVEDILLNEFVDKVFDFAYGMTFGNIGEHRKHRSGGQYDRKNGELFINTFQGKLCEFGLYKLFSKNGFITSIPDLDMWGTGKWDDVDLIINNKKLNVKSASFFSNLLLLETKDWDNNGNYIPNYNKTISNYDFHILARLKPDSKSLMSRNRLLYSNEVEKKFLTDLIKKENWFFDVAGFISHEDLKNIIINKHIIEQNSFLNERTKMDADNYYCQSGDMKSVTELINILKL
jgi:hypothetical protein